VVSACLGLPGLPETAETIEVARDLLLAEQTGARLHFCHLSTARAVDMLGEAQQRGLPVTADVTAHHLHLTEMDTADFNSQCHVLPPLRTPKDRQRLRAGLTEGIVAAVCSDHQPHERDARLRPFCATEPGISALETLLPLTLQLVQEGLMGLSQAVACLTCHPAAILGLQRGTLTVGAPGDVCIFDPEARWVLKEEGMVSRGHNTPFLGWELRGRVTHTFLAGKVVYELAEPAAR
jgi:dihydroorotase